MALPVTLVENGTPVTPAAQGIPVTIVNVANQPVVPLTAGDTFETDDGGTVTIDEITAGTITGATYTPA